MLQSLSRSFDRRQKFFLGPKGKKMCYHYTRPTTQGHMAWADFCCRKWNIVQHMCVGNMGENGHAPVHTCTHIPTSTSTKFISSCCCFVSRNISIQLWGLHVFQIQNKSVANNPGDAQNKLMKRTMCKLMWFVVLLQAIQTFKTMSFFLSENSKRGEQ